MSIFFRWGASPPIKKATRIWEFFLRIGGPKSEQVSINGILEKPGFRFCMHSNVVKFKKWSNLNGQSGQKWSNLNERSGTGWIERKIKSQILPILIFRDMVTFRNFCFKNCQFSINFHDNSKNENRKNVFSIVLTHCATFMKVGSKLRWGWGSVCR